MNKLAMNMCRRQCRFNTDNICTGCGRTNEEALNFHRVPEHKKIQINLDAKARLDKMQK